MAVEQPGYLVTLPANIDMSAKATYQFTFVWAQPATNIVGEGFGGNSCGPVGSLTTAPVGVLQHNPLQGEAANIVVNGITKCKAAGTIAVGAYVTWNSAGKCIAATTGTAAIGMAWEAAVNGDVTTILLKNFGTV